MKVHQRITLSTYLSMLFFIGLLTLAVSRVMADEDLIWDAYVPGTGETVVSPILEDGQPYRIVADEVWWYDWDFNLAADAQYYTTDGSNSWYWKNYFPAPGGHSFLQIDGQDVAWGSFSNGTTGHTYLIYYTGEGAAITFKIVDWIDGDYGNNDCKIRVRIYETVTVGGHVVDSNTVEAGIWLISFLMLTAIITVLAIKHYAKSIPA